MERQSLEYVMRARDELSGKLRRITAASDKTQSSLGRSNRQLVSMRSNFAHIGGQLPGVGSALSMIASPAGLAAAAVGGLAVVLNRATTAAADFNSEFRSLYNLNLSKTPVQIQAMRQMVLNTAQGFGFDAQQTSGAFYDVQSVAGLQGAAAREMVSKAGMFSRVMQSDFRQTIAGTSQVMDIYGLKVKDVDKYLANMFSTVLVGKTTFDEMSKVQVEYAQAASAVGQSYSSANKIFAAFSKTSKSVDIAATLTKTAFEGLTRQSTINGLKKFVDVFDAKGNIKQVDVILAELIPKLQGMSDLRFAKLKEEIGGTEGLKGLLDKARASGDALLSSFAQFDNSGMDYGKAVRAYNADLNELNKTINEKLEVSVIRLGQRTMPVWIELKKAAIDWLDGLDLKLQMLNLAFQKPDNSKIGSYSRSKYQRKGSQDMYAYFSNDVKELIAGGLQDNAVKAMLLRVEENAKNVVLPSGQGRELMNTSNERTGRIMAGLQIKNALANRDKAKLNELFGFAATTTATASPNDDGGSTPGALGGNNAGAKAIHSIGANSVREINITMNNDIDISPTGIDGTAEEMATVVEQEFNRMLQSIEEAYG